MTQTWRAVLVALGAVLLAITSIGLMINEQDATRACRAAQQNFDTLVRLVNVPARDPIERHQLLEVLGPRPTC